MYGKIVVYIKYCAVSLKLDIKCLEYKCSVSSPLRRQGLSLPLNGEDTDKCTLTITKNHKHVG